MNNLESILIIYLLVSYVLGVIMIFTVYFAPKKVSDIVFIIWFVVALPIALPIVLYKLKRRKRKQDLEKQFDDFIKEKEDKIIKQSLTEKWIDFMRTIKNDSDASLSIITKDEYDKYLSKMSKERIKNNTIPFYKHDLYYAFDITPHPMLKITEVVYSKTDYPSGSMDYWVEYVFKYKGKFYKITEIGGT